MNMACIISYKLYSIMHTNKQTNKQANQQNKTTIRLTANDASLRNWLMGFMPSEKTNKPSDMGNITG